MINRDPLPVIVIRYRDGEPYEAETIIPPTVKETWQLIAPAWEETTQEREVKPKEEKPAYVRPEQTLTFNGETRTITEWAAHTGKHVTTIRQRLKKGWPLEKVLDVNRHWGKK